jgi:hypothetical protein
MQAAPRSTRLRGGVDPASDQVSAASSSAQPSGVSPLADVSVRKKPRRRARFRAAMRAPVSWQKIAARGGCRGGITKGGAPGW